MNQRTARHLRWLGLALLIPALLYAILLGLANLSLKRAYDDLRREGRPIDLPRVMRARSEVRAAARLNSSGGNGACLYQAAALRLQAEPWPGEPHPQPSSPYGEVNLLGYATQVAREFIKDPSDQKAADDLRALFRNPAIQDAVDLLEVGAAKGVASFGLRYEGISTLLPHLADLRVSFDLLRAKARVQAMDGAVGAAWHTACTALAVADAPHDEAFAISQGFRCGQLEQAMTTIRALCEREQPDDSSRTVLLERLMLADDDQALVNALDGERLMWAGTFALSRQALSELFGRPSIPDMSSLGRKVLLESWFPPAWRADQAACLRLSLEWVRLAQLPYSRAADARIEAMASTLPFYCVLTRREFAQDSVEGPWRITRTPSRYLHMQAQTRLTRIGLALLDYRQQHGRYPDALDAIEAERLVAGPLRLPTADPWDTPRPEADLQETAKTRCLSDPFSRSPLVYRAEADGFLLYSVGPDQADDGGSEQAQPRPGYQGLTADIVWRYREPARAKP
jgi:hypothetical protein